MALNGCFFLGQLDPGELAKEEMAIVSVRDQPFLVLCDVEEGLQASFI